MLQQLLTKVATGKKKEIKEAFQLAKVNSIDLLPELKKIYQEVVSLVGNKKFTEQSLAETLSTKRLYLSNRDIDNEKLSLLVHFKQAEEINIYAYNSSISRSLPDLDHLSSLTHLTINSSALDTIGKLPNSLISLYLGNNHLTKIPDLSYLEKLVYLSLELNSISKLEKLPASLQTLGLDSNQLTELPDLSYLTQLERVHISYNKLTQFPLFASSVTELYAKKNKITSINLEHLVNLQELYLANNEITHISDCFEKLPKLNTLYVSSNQLTKLPKSLFNHPSLYALGLENNPLQLNENDLGILFNPQLTKGYFTEIGWNNIIAKKFRQFANACKKVEATQEEIKQFYSIINDDNKIKNYTKEIFFKSLDMQFPILQEKALQFLVINWEEKLIRHPINENVSLAFLGKSSYKRAEIKELLGQYNIEYDFKITEKTTHVVLNKKAKNYIGYERDHLIFIPETALQNFFNQQTNPEAFTKEEGQNISSLLDSTDYDNIALAFQMIQTLGCSKEAITSLFVIAKNTHNPIKIRKEALKYLNLFGSDQLKANLQKYNTKNIVSGNYLRDVMIKKDVENFVEGTELDVYKIVNYITIHDKYSKVGAFLPLISTDEKRLTLVIQQLEKKGAHSGHYEVSDSFFIDPSSIFRIPSHLVKYLEITTRYEELPQELIQFTQLEKLIIKRIGLTNLPNFFNQLTSLISIDISSNRLKNFPKVLEELPNINRIHLKNNAFCKNEKETPTKDFFDLQHYPQSIDRK